jgi:hypothetical protein
MRNSAESACVIAGAAAGSLLVGVFKLHPAWLWGAAAGAAGGTLAWVASWLLARPWPLTARIAAAAAVLAAGFFGLYVIAGGFWITDPRNLQVRPPGP